MYNELLKRHEEILKKLTEKASKETGFDERGQFMNLQKMIYSEIGFIEKLKELKEEKKNNEQNPTKQIEEDVVKKHDKYVYAYTDFVDNNSIMTLIYFDEFDGYDDINISNIRYVKSVNEAVESLFIADTMGYFVIVDNTMLGSDINLKLKSISDSIEIKLVRPTKKLNSEAYVRYSESTNKIHTLNKLAKESLDAFKEVKKILNDQGCITLCLERNDERESLLKAILLAYYTIVELNQ